MIQCRHHLCKVDGTVDFSQFARRWLIANTAHLCERDETSRSELPDCYGGIIEAPNQLDIPQQQKITSWQEDAVDDTERTLVQVAPTPTQSWMIGMAQQMMALSVQCNKQHEILWMIVTFN